MRRNLQLALILVVPISLILFLGCSVIVISSGQSKVNSGNAGLVNTFLAMNSFVGHLVDEREAVVAYVTGSGQPVTTKHRLVSLYAETDLSLTSLSVWPVSEGEARPYFKSSDEFRSYIAEYRYTMLVAYHETGLLSIEIYADMIDEVKKWSEDVLFRIVDLGIWNDLVSLKLLISAKVYFCLDRTYGTLFWHSLRTELKRDEYFSTAVNYLTTAVLYSNTLHELYTGNARYTRNTLAIDNIPTLRNKMLTTVNGHSTTQRADNSTTGNDTATATPTSGYEQGGDLDLGAFSAWYANCSQVIDSLSAVEVVVRRHIRSDIRLLKMHQIAYVCVPLAAILLPSLLLIWWCRELCLYYEQNDLYDIIVVILNKRYDKLRVYSTRMLNSNVPRYLIKCQHYSVESKLFQNVLIMAVDISEHCAYGYQVESNIREFTNLIDNLLCNMFSNVHLSDGHINSIVLVAGIEGDPDRDRESILSLYNFSLEISKQSKIKNTLKIAFNAGVIHTNLFSRNGRLHYSITGAAIDEAIRVSKYIETDQVYICKLATTLMEPLCNLQLDNRLVDTLVLSNVSSCGQELDVYLP